MSEPLKNTKNKKNIEEAKWILDEMIKNLNASCKRNK